MEAFRDGFLGLSSAAFRHAENLDGFEIRQGMAWRGRSTSTDRVIVLWFRCFVRLEVVQ